jgi:hypothetical protein
MLSPAAEAVRATTKSRASSSRSAFSTGDLPWMKIRAQVKDMVPDEVRSRYAMAFDGELLDSKRVKYLTKYSLLAKEYLTQITDLNDWINAYKGQIDGLQHELPVTKYQWDQATLWIADAALERYLAVLPRLDHLTNAEPEIRRHLHASHGFRYLHRRTWGSCPAPIRAHMRVCAETMVKRRSLEG